MSDDWIKVHSEMDQAFQRDQVASAKEEDLQRWLQNLCTGSVKNPDIHHREIIRGLTIQHIQLSRVIARLDAQNTKTQKLFLALAIGTLVLTALGVATAVLLG